MSVYVWWLPLNTNSSAELCTFTDTGTRASTDFGAIRRTVVVLGA